MIKIKGSTLVETIVAMVLLILISLIFFSIFSNILNENFDFSEFKSKAMLEDISIKSKKEKIYLDEVLRSGNLVITKSFYNYKNNPGIIVMDLKMSTPGNKVKATMKEILLLE